MFQYAVRDLLHSSSDRRKAVNGETLSRRFVAFLDAEETLLFFSMWYAAQMHPPLNDFQAKTMLYECGSFDDLAPRKWILDIDAPLDDLRKHFGVAEAIMWEELVLDFAAAVTQELVTLGFLGQPCPFVVLSRHVPDRKLSWHVTLCALAPFPVWRQAILMLQKGDPMKKKALAWKMFRFVDPTTVRNTKSQYMQVLAAALILKQ